MAVTIVGVRHHSPACARVVRHVIATRRPRFVLVEGPSSMNTRLDELALGHRLPIALYSFSNRGERRSASFYPFADYSPEWVALTEARACGASAMFIDLPPQHAAFSGRENLYSDEELRRSRRWDELLGTLGFDNTDALWDHLFEQPGAPETLQARLEAYFVALRADEAADAGDRARERFMAQYVAWAAAEAADGNVVVVCGGYHAPELARLVPGMLASLPDPEAFQLEEPADEQPADELPARAAADEPPAREGTYLVPFSFQRLDAFRGYASGMPSPAFYQEVWEHGPERGAQRMFERAIQALRARKQPVSPADAIAANSMTDALRRVRDHACALRTDVLDGLATALVKDAIDVPLPWSRREVLSPRTHPMLALVVDAFAGERHGKLAVGTPRPPLVDDAHAELARVGVPPGGRTDVEAALDTTEGRARSHVLHRLRLLQIPGVSLVAGRDFRRGSARLTERWRVAYSVAFDPALIEAAVWGASLADATRGALEARAHAAAGAPALADVLFEASLAGLGALSHVTLERLRTGLLVEPDLALLGQALARLVLLARDPAAGVDDAVLAQTVTTAFHRGTWLLEGIVGASAPPSRGHVEAVVALRDTLRWLGPALELDVATVAALALRRAHDAEAPLALRGACLGLLASLTPELAAAGVPPCPEEELSGAVRAVAPVRLGELLLGMFALARERLREGDVLLGAVARAIGDAESQQFLHALPTLRRAFGYFPPRERFALAERLVAGVGRVQAGSLVAAVNSEVVARGLARDDAAAAAFVRFGLEST